MAVLNRLRHYIYIKGKALKYIDKFNKQVNEIKLAVWLIQEARDLNIKIVIKLNIKSISV